MKKIGIYLASEPFFGGTYQYNLSIISALGNLDKNKYAINAFYYDESWNSLLPDSFIKIKTKKPSLLLRAVSKFYRLIDRSDMGLRRFDSFFNPMACLINKSFCELVIYPSQDKMSYLTSVNSLTAIHDLMHRYESHFEEYKHGEIVARDKHYRMICQYSKGILVDSDIGKNQVLESYNIASDKVFKLPFIPPNYLLESNEVDLSSKFNLPEKFIFYPAQFWEHKNHLRLIEAIKILKDRNIDVNLVLVGSKKNNYEKVLSKISEYGIEDRVKVLGYVSNDVIYTLYKKAVGMCFVSLIGPTNIPPMEAMLCGCPLICSNVYAMPNQTGDAALLVDPFDSKAIANAIELIWLNDSLRLDLKNKGLAKTKEYNQSDFNLLFENIIHKLA